MRFLNFDCIKLANFVLQRKGKVRKYNLSRTLIYSSRHWSFSKSHKIWLCHRPKKDFFDKYALTLTFKLRKPLKECSPSLLFSRSSRLSFPRCFRSRRSSPFPPRFPPRRLLPIPSSTPRWAGWAGFWGNILINRFMYAGPDWICSQGKVRFEFLFREG